MASLNGKWKLSEVKNFSAYLDAISVSDDNKKKALAFLTPENNITQDITIGDKVIIKTTTPIGTTDIKAEFGQELERKDFDGRDIKIVFKGDDVTLTEYQTGPFTSTYIRTVEGGEMVMTLSSGDATSTRKYIRM